MTNQIEWEWNHLPKAENDYLETMDQEIIREVQAFHQTFPEYSITPLVALQTMEQYLGVANICIKDESYRFGLNAFKVLGGSYAIAKYLRNQSNIDTTDYTFFTATDGNLGRGVAWAAVLITQKAVVWML